MNRLARLLPVLALLTLAACSTVPETGRRQLLITSASQETEMGLAAFAEVKKETAILTDAGTQARIEKIGRRITG